jgi:DNA-directed RNA polymerase sigma subunit (sigma70/sigma32)
MTAPLTTEQRRELALRLWQQEGMSYAAIGKRLGVSRQRVHQIVGEALGVKRVYMKRK